MTSRWVEVVARGDSWQACQMLGRRTITLEAVSDQGTAMSRVVCVQTTVNPGNAVVTVHTCSACH